jgi:hypothetical protein
MVRTVITPQDTHIELDIPQEYVGKPLEIIYQALDEEQSDSPKKTMKDFLGILSDKTASDLQEEIKLGRDEWDKRI